MMSLKPPSILHSVDSITVLVGRLITSSALYIIIFEAPAIREVSLDDHCRFFFRNSIKKLQYHKTALLPLMVPNTVHMLSMHYLN